MTLNTIKLSPEDLDQGRILRQRLLQGTLSLEDACELERILENERYVAIREGNIHVLAAINYFLNRLDAFLSKSNKTRRLPLMISPSNLIAEATSYLSGICPRCKKSITTYGLIPPECPSCGFSIREDKQDNSDSQLTN